MSIFRRSDHFSGEDLSAYIDGQAGARTAAIDAHVSGCDLCADILAELRDAKAVVAELPRIQSTRSFTLGPEFAVAKPRPVAQPAIFRFAPAMSGLALVLFVALIFVDSSGSIGNDDSASLNEKTTMSRSSAESAQDSAGTAGGATQRDAASAPAIAPTTPPAAAPAPNMPPANSNGPAAVTAPDSGSEQDNFGSQPTVSASPDDGDDDGWVRPLQVIAAIAFLGFLALALVPRFRRKGSS